MPNRKRKPLNIPSFCDAIDQTTDAVLVVDFDSRTILTCNSAAERLFGYDASELIGETSQNLHLDSVSYNLFGEEASLALENDPSFLRRIPLRDKMGKLLLADAHVIPLETYSSSRIVISIIRPTPESGAAKRDAGSQVELEIQGILKRICRTHGWVYGEVWLPHPEGYLELCTTWSMDSKLTRPLQEITYSIRFKLREGAPGRVWESGRPELLTNLWGAPRHVFRRAFVAKALGLRSCLSIPIMAGSDIVAIATFFGCDVRHQAVDELVATHSELNCLQEKVISHLSAGGFVEQVDALSPSDHLKQDAPRWVCEPNTLVVLDANQVVQTDCQQNHIRCLRSNLLECLERQGRHLVGDQEIVPRSMHTKSYSPYRFTPDDGSERWGILECYFIPWHNGYALSAQAIDTPAGSPSLVTPNTEKFRSLTLREREIVALVINGLSSKKIARRLGISHRTVETHRSAIMRKLGLSSIAQIIKLYGPLINSKE
ncbi:PAS domain S-box protein [bacterium SCSIO 12827]|nr:PAS domain S-box protein [bacterium SCSIO 12827]